MAVPTISISGSVLTPSGDAPTSGRFTIKLSTAGSVTDTDTGAVVRVATEETVDLTAGAIAVSLVPNESITPTGTYYLVSAICVMPSGRRVQWSEKWQLAASPVTIDIGSVPRTDIQAGVAASHVGDWPAQAAAQVASAAAYAASAAEDAAAADAWAAQAETSAAAAAVSAAAASSISGIYADTTAGLAATASGSYFYTVSSDPYVLILYLDNAGVAVEQGRVSAATAVQALQRALTPEATDTSGDLLAVADAAGRVVARIDSTSGLRLVGFDGTAQARLALISPPSDTNSHPFYVLDNYNRVLAYIDSAGGFRVPGITGTVQDAAEEAALAYRERGALAGTVTLPSSFAMLGTPLRGQERFRWSGSPPALRDSEAYFQSYPFQWSGAAHMVAASDVRRARAPVANLTQPPTWTNTAITVNAPVDWFTTHQFRDISPIYDRATSTWYCVVNSINVGATFYSTGFTCFSSSDGLAWDWVCEVTGITGLPAGTEKVWSPEFFVDDDGSVYVIVSANSSSGNEWAYHLHQCSDLSTFASWTYVGRITGTALPQYSSPARYMMIDPFLIRRQGVYTLIWKNESALTGYDLGRLGWAASTSILGPYDQGGAFTAPGSEPIIGEGQCVNELPAGSPYRYRLTWDNYLGTLYRGVYRLGNLYADTNDFITFSEVQDLGYLTTFERHASVVIGA